MMRFEEILNYLQSDEFYAETMIFSGFNNFRKFVSRTRVVRELQDLIYSDPKYAIRIFRTIMRLLYKEGGTKTMFYNEPAICALLLAIGETGFPEARELFRKLAGINNPLMGWIPKMAGYLCTQGQEIILETEQLQEPTQFENVEFSSSKPTEDTWKMAA